MLFIANNVRNRSTILYHEASKFETFCETTATFFHLLSVVAILTNTIYNYTFFVKIALPTIKYAKC